MLQILTGIKKTNSLAKIAVFCLFALVLSQCEIISVQSQNNLAEQTSANYSSDNQNQWKDNLYYKHFNQLFGPFIDSVIAFEEDIAKLLINLQSRRVSNSKWIKSYFNKFTPGILAEFQQTNLWTSLPLTNLPYSVLSKLHKTIQNQKSILTNFGINDSVQSVVAFTQSLMENKQLIKNMSLQLKLQNQLRNIFQQRLLANHGRKVQKYFNTFADLGKSGMISDKFIAQFGLLNSKNLTKRAQSVQTQLDQLFGKEIVDEFTTLNPQIYQKFDDFNRRGEKILKWYDENRINFQRSELKLNWQNQQSLQQLINPVSRDKEYNFSQISKMTDFINFRKVYDFELSNILRKNITDLQFTNFIRTYDFTRQAYSLQDLLNKWSQLYEEIRQFWNKKQLVTHKSLQRLSKKNSYTITEDYSYQKSCYSYDVYANGRQFKIQNDLYYGNRPITWDQLMEYQQIIPINSQIQLKSYDYYFEQSQSIFKNIKIFPEEKQEDYLRFLEISEISDEQFKQLSQKSNQYIYVKLYRNQDENQVLYDCNHIVFIRNEDHKTTILFM